LCALLEESIHEYMRGLPHRAYARLDQGIRNIMPEFSRFLQPVDHAFQKELYRMRVEHEPGVTFSKPDLFHIPFDKRHKVTRQRYSIPGLPCLYLGGTLYICWEELRRPKFESIHVARFQVADGQQISVLDFMQRPRHMAQNIRNNLPAANEDPQMLRFAALAV